MSRNNELHQACQAWLQAALQFLSTKPLLYKETLQVTFNPNGYSTRGGVFTIGHFGLTNMYMSQLLTLPEYKSILNLATNTPDLLSMLLADFSGFITAEQGEVQQAWLGRYFFTLLSEYLHRKGDLTFSSAIFDHLYEQLEQYVYNTGSFHGIWLVHLRNLRSEIERIRIDHNLYLRQTTEEEKIDIIRKSSRLIDLSDLSTLTMHPAPDVPDAFLEIHQPIGRIGMPNQPEATQIAQTVVLALRLIKDNPVGIASYRWSIPEQPFHMLNGVFPADSAVLPPSAFSGERYIFTQEDADVLPTLYRKAEKAYKKANLATVITRFEDSYLRTKPEDKLIDYWTGLEALFFSMDEFRDMGKSLALAASYYLGRTEEERNSIYTDLTRSHSLRSHFIHGERKKPNLNLPEMETKTGNHLRHALRKRIEE